MCHAWNPQYEKRYHQLALALGRSKLFLRPDATICWNYVYNGRGSVREAVAMTAQARYLHQYCDFDKGHQLALWRRSQMRGAVDFRRLVNECVLETSKSKRFPTTWPWMLKNKKQKK